MKMFKDALKHVVFKLEIRYKDKRQKVGLDVKSDNKKKKNVKTIRKIPMELMILLLPSSKRFYLSSLERAFVQQNVPEKGKKKFYSIYKMNE